MKKYFTGSLFVLWMFLTATAGIGVGNLAFLLAFGGAVDISEGIIPNRVCLFVALSGFCEIIWGPGSRALYMAVNIVISVILLLLLKLMAREHIGYGDIKLLMACSFSLELVSLMTGLALASLGAATAGIMGKKTLKGEVSFGPFIAVSMALVKIAEYV